MPEYCCIYASIVFDFDVGEEGRVAEIGLSAGTDVVSVVGFVPASASSSGLLEGMLKTGWKHLNINIKLAPH